MKVIIRDDDISFFTPSDKLKSIYAPIIKKSIPINISIIPCHSSRSFPEKGMMKQGILYEPNIPPKYREKEQEYPINMNKPLVDYITSLSKKDLIEIAMHGYNHQHIDGIYEFENDEKNMIRKKLDTGKKILKETFPDSGIGTFVAPWDSLSFEAFDCLVEKGYNLFLRKKDILRYLPKRYCTQAILTWAGIKRYNYIRYKKSNIFFIDDYFFGSMDNNTDDIKNNLYRHIARFEKAYKKKEKLFVIVMHYWQFMDNFKEINNLKVGCLYRLIEHISSKKDIEFITYSQLKKD